MIELGLLALTFFVVVLGRWLTRDRFPVGSWMLVDGALHWVTDYNGKTSTITFTPAGGRRFLRTPLVPPKFSKQ